MSWDDYVNSLLPQGISSAAIIGFNGQTWAATKGFSVSVEEGLALVQGFGKPSVFVKDGVLIGGATFIYIRNSERTVFAKRDIECVLIVRTLKAFVIARFNGQPHNSSAVVEKLADYLISVGY